LPALADLGQNTELLALCEQLKACQVEFDRIEDSDDYGDAEDAINAANPHALEVVKAIITGPNSSSRPRA
jgi:hypothetical protein